MKVEVDVSDISQSKKSLMIEVAEEEVKLEFDKAYAAFSRVAKVPGFRKGHVPRGVIKQRFAKDVRDEVIGQLLPHALHHVLVDRKLRMVGEPHIDDIEINEGEPLKFKAKIDVIPDFELKDYKALKLTKRISRITDDDVERMINQFRESRAEFVPVEDRPSQEGDFVSINVVGKFIDPPEVEDLKTDDVQIELGSSHVQKEFNENLLGVKAGDIREFRLVYPEDFSSEGLAGKTLDFTATVMAVRQKELPELTDEFAKEVSEAETVEEMKKLIYDGLVNNSEIEAEAKLRGDLVQKIISFYDFELPSSLIEKEAVEKTREHAYMMLRNGVSPDSIRGMNWDNQMAKAREVALRELRAALVVSSIGDVEGVEVSDEELDAEIARIAESLNQSPADVRARLTKEKGLSSIENSLRYNKVLDVILSTAEVTIEEGSG